MHRSYILTIYIIHNCFRTRPIYNCRTSSAMKIVDKNELENICLRALNQVARFREVRSVTLAWRSPRSAEWTIREIEPRFHISDVKGSYAVIRDLQSRYRMISLTDTSAEGMNAVRPTRMIAVNGHPRPPRRAAAANSQRVKVGELGRAPLAHRR